MNLITVAEASLMLGVSSTQIHRLILAGTLTPRIKLPGLRGAYLLSPTDVERLIK